MNLNTLYKKRTNGKHTIGYKFILSLFVGFIGFISFGYCDFLGGYSANEVRISGTKTFVVPDGQFYCVRTTTQGCTMSPGWNDGGPNANILYGYALYCFDGTFEITCPGINVGVFSGFVFPKMSSIDCQTEYNLIPINEVTENYCVTNGLCPSNVITGEDLSGVNWSSLYINDIQYPGAPLINITIPEEIQREQNTDEEETNIDIVGYGYDQDKMQQMVNTQYYKPTAEEMSGLVEKVADFLPLVAIALLIARIRRVIKKVF